MELVIGKKVYDTWNDCFVWMGEETSCGGMVFCSKFENSDTGAYYDIDRLEEV